MAIRSRFAAPAAFGKAMDGGAADQIKRLCEYDFTEGNHIRFMPDAHPGKGCATGTPMNIQNQETCLSSHGIR